MAEVPVIRLEGLTEPQKRALALADNKLGMNAGWDEKLLAAELQGLGELQGVVGFSADELMRLLGGHEGLTDPDEAPESTGGTGYAGWATSGSSGRTGWFAAMQHRRPTWR